MDIDPENCIVVFEFDAASGEQKAVHSVPTRAEDGIQQAWAMVLSEHETSTAAVQRIYSEWSVTPADERFLRSEMPDAEFVFSFERPEHGDGWTAALEEARQQLIEQAEEESNDRADVSGPMLLPLLRNNDPTNPLTESMLSMPLGRTGLIMVVGEVAPTPQGTIGTQYVMKAAVPDDEVDATIDEAIRNLESGLQVQGGKSGTGDSVAIVTHPYDCGSSAIVLPGLFEQACEWLDCSGLFLAIPSPGMLLIAPSGSAAADEFRSNTMEAECLDGEPLSPSCFEFDGKGVRRIATHPNGTWDSM